MSETPQQNAEVVLSGIADLRYADELHKALLAAVDQGGDVTVYGSAVERVTTSCIQLLVSAARSLEQNPGRRFRLAEPSDILAEAFQDLGLETLLDEWS